MEHKHTPGPWEALEAIRARISGQFDNPALDIYGPLSTDTIADIAYIIKKATESATRDITFDQYAGNAGAYFCALCGGYDPHGATPYRQWPVRVSVLIGHNIDCPRFDGLPTVDGQAFDPRGCGCADCRSTPHTCNSYGDLKMILGELVEMNRRDEIGDPDLLMTPEAQEQLWCAARTALAEPTAPVTHS